MPDTRSLARGVSANQILLWLAATWLLLVPAIAWCYRHADRPLALWFEARQSSQWPLLYWPHRIVDVFVFSLPLIFIVCSIAWWRQRGSATLRPVFDAAMALAVVLAVKAPVKALFGRTWPDTFHGNNPSYLEHGVYGFVPLQWQIAYWAFPSGHAAQIVAITVALALHQPRLTWLFAPLSVFVMADLVALNYHWLSDVLAGVLLGASAAVLVQQLDFIGQLDEWRERRRAQRCRASSMQR
jgi:membrane-associated phospholipid phosphatase